jgi:hypothetical protein
MEPIRAQYTDRYEVHKGERVLVMEILPGHCRGRYEAVCINQDRHLVTVPLEDLHDCERV